MSDSFDPYYSWLGVRPEEQPPNHYRLLGLQPFEDNPQVIENAADQRMAFLRTLQVGERGPLSQKLLSEIAMARRCLLRSDTKAEYDAALRRGLGLAVPPVSDWPAASDLGPPTPASSLWDDSLPAPSAVTLSPPCAGPPADSAWSPFTVAAVALGTLFLGLSLIIGVMVVRRMWRDAPRPVETAQDDAVSEPLPTAKGPETATDSASADMPPSPTTAPGQPTESESRRPGVAQTGEETPPPVSAPAVAPPPVAPVLGATHKEVGPTAGNGAPPREPTSKPPPAARETRLPVGADTSPGALAAEANAVVEGESRRRRAIPSGESLRQVTAQVEDLYRLRTTVAPAARLKLARELLQVAERSKDNPEEQYVLFRQAALLACDVGSATVMLEAVDAMADEFEMQGPRVQAELLIRILGPGDNPLRVWEFLKSTGPVVARALAQDDYATAFRVSETASKLCDRPVGRGEVRQLIRDRHPRVAWLYQQSGKVHDSNVALERNPDDPTANSAAGRWHCFVKEDWDVGLPYLAKGSEPRLREIAQRELTGVLTDAKDQIDMGHLWWEWAQAAEANEKLAVLHRAQHWYERVDPERVSGITRIKLERRQEELAGLLAKAEQSDWNADVAEAKTEERADDSAGQETSDELRTLFARGLGAAMQDGDFRQAERLFHRCQQIDAHHVPSLNNAALVYLHNRNPRRAVQLWKAACDAGSPAAEVSHNLARLRELAGNGIIALDRSTLRTVDGLLAKAPGSSRAARSGHLCYMPFDAHGSRAGDSLYDRVCLNCNGLGTVKCPARGCARGSVPSTRREVAGRNPITGDLLVKDIASRVRCGNCGGRGQVRCPVCHNGRM
jgi:tetratricopeptide (TPR) repeat protein